MVDACKVGICSLYDSGSGIVGLIVGIAVGAAVILAIQRIAKRRRDE
jgi:hypothetical protein